MKQLLKLTGCLALAGLFASCQSAQQEANYQIIRFILSRKGDILHSESTNDKTPEGPEIVFIYPIASESK